MVTTVTSPRPTPLLGHYERELYMTSHDSLPPKKVVNIDKLAIVNDARKIIEVVLNLAIEANRGLSAEECEVLAAVTRLIDESADACLEHMYESARSEPPDKPSSTEQKT